MKIIPIDKDCSKREGNSISLIVNRSGFRGNQISIAYLNMLKQMDELINLHNNKTYISDKDQKK